MSERLLNKVAVVTGGGSGIGRAIAERFLAEGAKVVVFGRTRADLEAVAADAPARTLAVAGDVADVADLQRLVSATTRRFGGVDVLVPAAGIARAVPLSECTAETIDEQFRVNFAGALETVRVFLPHFNEGAAVLFITASPKPAAAAGMGVHDASKAALAAAARSLAVELAPRKIRVNSIAPGPVATPLWEKLGLAAGKLKSVRSRVRNRLLAGEFCRPDDVAQAAVFLASDAAANIVGQEIVVDGGYTIG